MTATDQAQDDGYVACSECGHPIEKHTRQAVRQHTSCFEVEGCVCRVTWTVAEVRSMRAEHGLPRTWPANL